jgi:hypothetical protein
MYAHMHTHMHTHMHMDLHEHLRPRLVVWLATGLVALTGCGGGSGAADAAAASVPPALEATDTIAPCAGPPDPAAGTLAFERADFEVGERAGAGTFITVVRSGGTKGAVSVAFHTLESGAKANQDFEPMSGRLVFRDGESVRTVPVPIIDDASAELDEVLGVRIDDPHGCVALGAQRDAALAIVDDDRAPSSAAPTTVGGTVSGLVGKGLVLEDRAQRIELSIDADGAFAFDSATR